MALSSFLRNIHPPVLRGSLLGSLNKKLVAPSCSFPCIRQTYYHQLTTNENRGKELSAASRSLKLVETKQFATSPALLASHKGHDHSKLWTLEKILSAALLPLVPSALIFPCQALDTALALIVTAHTHFGIEAVVVDYVRPILFGEVIPKLGLACVYLFSIIVLSGLLNLIYNDTGLANAIIQIWMK